MKKKFTQPLAVLLAANMAMPATMPAIPTYAKEKEKETKNVATDSDAEKEDEDDVVNDVEITKEETTEETNNNVSNDILDDIDEQMLDENNISVVDAQDKTTLTATIANIEGKTWDGTDTITGSFGLSLSNYDNDHPNVEIDYDKSDIHFEDSDVGKNKKVIARIVLKGSDASYYQMSSEEYTFDTNVEITKRVLTVTAASVTTRYYKEGDTSVTVSPSISNIAPVDMSGSSLNKKLLSVTVDASYDSADAGNNKPVTINGIALSGEHAGNYEVENAIGSITGTIKKATKNAPSLSLTNTAISGTDTSMEYRVNSGSWQNCTGSSITVSGTGIYEVRYKETANYEASGIYAAKVGNTEADPSKIEVSIEGNPTKEYDGTNNAYCSIGLSGLAAGDGSKIKIESYDATYSQSTVGDNLEVTVSNIVLSGEKAATYQPYLDGKTFKTTGSITQRTIDVWVAAKDKTYDGTTAADLYACKYTNFASGDNMTIAVTGAFEDANAGENKKITIGGVTLNGDAQSNYKIGTITPASISGNNVTELSTLTAKINKKFIEAPNKELFSSQGGYLVGFNSYMEYSIDGVNWAACDSNTKIKGVNGTIYQFRYKGDTTNYNLGVTKITYNVTASVTITYSINGEQVTGEYPTSRTLTVGTMYTDAMLPDITSADSSRVFLGWYTESTNGTKITAGMTCDNTSDFTLYAHFKDDENKKAGNIRIVANSVEYGTIPEVTPENIGDSDYTNFSKYYKLKTAADTEYTLDIPTDPGDYTVKVVASGSSKYKNAEQTADFSITRRKIVYVIKPKDKVYNALTDVSYEASASGGIVSWKNSNNEWVNDDVTVDTSELKVQFVDKNVGQDKTVTASGIKMTGTDAGKYEISCKVDGKASITPVDITYTDQTSISGTTPKYTLQATNKTYDGTTSATITGLTAAYKGDTVTVEATGTFSDANAGTGKTVNITNGSVTLGGEDAKNYNLILPASFNVKGTIYKAQNTNSVKDVIKFNNPTNGLNNGSITGLTTDMEYSTNNNTWKAVTGDSLTGLAAGTYYVRYKETANYYASGATYATLTNSGSSTTRLTVSFNTNGESVSETSVGSVTATVGSAYGTLPTVTPTDKNREFIGWFTESTGGTEVTKDTICKATDATTLYAHYKNIEKRNGAITVSMEDFTYGDVTPSPTYKNVAGNYKDENVRYYYKVSTASETTYSTTVPTTPGTYTVKAVASATVDYASTSATSNFTIKKRKVTATVTADTKVYDGSTTVTGYSVTTDQSIVSGDYVTLNKDNAVVTFKDASVGTNKELVISGFTLNGTKKDYYELVVTGTGTITENKVYKSEGQITVSVSDYTYGSIASEVKIANVVGSYTTYDTTYCLVGTDNWTSTRPVDPGTYKVKVIAAETEHHYAATAETTFTIKKIAQNTPSIKAETGKNLECISGTTADMEYSTDKNTWYPCSDGTTPVSATGTYYVRYKETATHAASDPVSYEVAKNEVTVKFVSDRNTVGTVTIKSGQTIDASQVPQLTKKGMKINYWYCYWTTGITQTESGSMSACGYVGFTFGADTIANKDGKVVVTIKSSGTTYTLEDNTLYANWVDDETGKQNGKITVSMADFTYGDAASTPVKNIVSGDYESVSYQYKPKNSADTAYTSVVPTLPGDYVVKATAKMTQAYNAAVAYDEFTIRKRPVNVTVTTPAKIYDGTTTVSQYSYKVDDNSFVSGDNVSVIKDNASVKFASKNTGTQKLVISGLVLTGDQKDRYELGTVSGYGIINKKDISNITVKAEDKDYDGTKNVTATLSSSDIVPGDNVTMTGKSTLDSSDVGSRTVTVSSISLSGSDSANYNLTKTTATGKATVRNTTNTVSFDTTGVKVNGSIDLKSLKIHDKYPALPDAESTDPEYKFVGWAKEDGTRVYEGSEYLGETTLKPVLEKIKDFSYSIQYVTENGDVLGTVTGTANNNESVTAEAKTFDFYEYTGNDAYIVKAGNTNVFKVVCKERVFNIELVMVNETTGKIFAREKGTYSINHPYEKMSGAVPAHMHFTGFSGHSANHGTWSFAGYESDTTWSFDLFGYVEDCWIYLAFTADPSDVTFDANNGEGSMTGAYASDTTTLPENTFTKKGYVFKGWSTTKDGAVEYEDGAPISEIPSGTKLYAVWEKATIDVKFDLGGVTSLTSVPDSMSITLGDKYPTLPTPVATDGTLSFLGWYTEDGTEVHAGDEFEGDKVLYAKFANRKKGSIKLTAKDYAYGDTPDISTKVMYGNYKDSDISYRYHIKGSNEWFTGLPTLPGDYVVRATAAGNDEMLDATADAYVTVKQRTLTFHLENTDKVYNGDESATPTYVIDNKVGSDDVTLSGTAVYDSKMPGNRTLKATNFVLSGNEASRYKVDKTSIETDAYIDKKAGEAVSVTSKNETIWGKGDGVLYGTTTGMEYRVDGGAWMDASETVTGSLFSGTYDIRMKETDISYAGPVKTLSIYADRTLRENLTDVNGTVTTYGIAYGAKIDKPVDPYKSGYTFNGWYTDTAFTTKYDFDAAVTDDVSLYPKFTRRSSSGGSSSGGSSSGSTYSSSYKPSSGAVNGTWTMDSNMHWRLTSGQKSYKNEWAYAVNPYAKTANGQPANSWFHFNAEGIMETGWITDSDGRMYYLNPTSDGTLGAMYTGWHWIKQANGKSRCYYFQEVSDGHRGMLYKGTTTPDGYTVDATGAWTVNGIVVEK